MLVKCVQILQIVAIALSYLLELDSKMPLLKHHILESWTVKISSHDKKLHAYWLDFMVLEGAPQPPGEKSNQQSYSAVN